jgi:hypothetical protein
MPSPGESRLCDGETLITLLLQTDNDDRVVLSSRAKSRPVIYMRSFSSAQPLKLVVADNAWVRRETMSFFSRRRTDRIAHLWRVEGRRVLRARSVPAL